MSELGLDADWLRSPKGIELLAGNGFPVNVRPIAQAYAGRQFGDFVPQLGDGRAALGPMMREYIVSEAMYALGISTHADPVAGLHW